MSQFNSQQLSYLKQLYFDCGGQTRRLFIADRYEEPVTNIVQTKIETDPSIQQAILDQVSINTYSRAETDQQTMSLAASISANTSVINSNTTAISNLNADMSDFSDLVQNDLTTLGAAIDLVFQDTEKLKNNMINNNTQLDTHASQIESLIGNSNTANSDINSLSWANTTNQLNIANLQSATATNINNINTLQNANTTNIASINQHTLSINSHISSIASHDASINTLTASVTTINNKNASQDIRLDQAELENNNNGNNISTLINTVNVLNNTSNSQSSSITTISSSLNTATSNITTLQTSMTSANTKITTLQTNNTTNQTNITTLQNQVAALQTAVTTLQNSPAITGMATLKNQILQQTNRFRTGGVRIGDIVSSAVVNLPNVWGCVTSATNLGTTWRFQITYEDAGYKPMVIFSYGDTLASNAEANDIQPIATLDYLTTNTSCTFMLQESTTRTQNANVYVMLVYGEMTPATNLVI